MEKVRKPVTPKPVACLPFGDTEHKSSFYGNLSQICALSCSLSKRGQICAKLCSLSLWVSTKYMRPAPLVAESVVHIWGTERGDGRSRLDSKAMTPGLLGRCWANSLSTWMTRLSVVGNTRVQAGPFLLTSQANSLNCSPRIL